MRLLFNQYRLKSIFYPLTFLLICCNFLISQELENRLSANDSYTLDDNNTFDSIEVHTDIVKESYSFYPKSLDKNQIIIFIPEQHNSKRILTNSGVILGASLVSMGILYALPESVTNWDAESRDLSNIGSKWYRNVSEGPVLDQDNFFLNWVMHPYFGAVYYMGMRGAGYKWFPSFLFSTAVSSLYWEYGVEALAERPSLQDLIITPTVGSVLGEGFFWAKKKIKGSHDRVMGSLVVGRSCLFLLDPLNEVYDIFMRKKIHKRYRSQAEISSYFLPSAKGVSFGFTYQF